MADAWFRPVAAGRHRLLSDEERPACSWFEKMAAMKRISASDAISVGTAWVNLPVVPNKTMATSNRLRIEPLRAAHAEVMYPIQLDERIYRYIPTRRYATLDDLAERFRKLEAGSPDPGQAWLNWCLFLREDGSAIGHLQASISLVDRAAWVAYVLTPGAWGHGYATEALAWLLDHLASACHVDLARAQIDSRNTASLAVVQRLDFERKRDVTESGSVDHVYEKSI